MHGFNEKVTKLREKGRIIQELIEKARPTADPELREVLGKWEEANLKIFERHPVDRPDDLGVLEEVQDEINGQKAIEPGHTSQGKSEEDHKSREQTV